MPTAVLISGEMRTFASNYANLRWHVFRRVRDPVFVVSCADDANAASADLLRQDFRDVFIERVVQPDGFDDEATAVAAIGHAPYEPSPSSAHGARFTVARRILRQLWAQQRVWDFASEQGVLSRYSDVFVRLRPDLFFHRIDWPTEVSPLDFYGPWKGTFGGVNDRFGIMGAAVAGSYFRLFSRWPEFVAAGCPFHPESMLQHTLEQVGAAIHSTLLAEFTIARTPESGLPHERAGEGPGELARFIAAVSAR